VSPASRENNGIKLGYLIDHGTGPPEKRRWKGEGGRGFFYSSRVGQSGLKDRLIVGAVERIVRGSTEIPQKR